MAVEGPVFPGVVRERDFRLRELVPTPLNLRSLRRASQESKLAIAPDRDPRIGFGDLTELHSDVAFARIRAHLFREHERRS